MMNDNKRNGFSLIELLVVISIIGILMGLVISQLGGILGSSDKTKMQAVMRSWIVNLKQYKSHYGYYPPFLYEGSEGEAISLSDPIENQSKFLFALKGLEKTEDGWKEGDNYLVENKDRKQFYSFSDDEFSADGNLMAWESIRILIDHDRDGVISLEGGTVDEIKSALSLEYDEGEMSRLESSLDQFGLIYEEIAFYILNDEISGLSNVFSWNIEKYFESE